MTKLKTPPAIDAARRNLSSAATESMRDSGGCTFDEADGNLNDASRRVIDAYARRYGLPWIGNYNVTPQKYMYPSTPKHSAVALWQHHPDNFVYNFTGSFVLPGHDAELECLIVDYNSAMRRLYSSGLTHAGSADRERVAGRHPMDYLDAISNRVIELGGTILHWS